VQARGAGGNDSDVGAFEAKLHRHMPRDHVDDAGGYKKRRNAARAPVGQLGMGVFDQWQSANARANIAANTHGFVIGQCLAGGQARVGHGLHGGGNAVVDKGVHAAGFFGGHVVLHVKTLHLTRNFAGKGAGIKLGDGVNTRVACQQVAPGGLHRIAHRADAAQTRHYHSAFSHVLVIH
jgi:hypothetical protein